MVSASGARPGLDRASVAAAALDLLDEVGLDGLTVRRLATELGVQSPALYWHFRNKQELLDLMAQRLMSVESHTGLEDGEPWTAWVARRARERRRLLLSRRDGARLIVGTSSGPEIARTFEADLCQLTELGFTPVQGLRALIAIGHYVTGFVAEEQAAAQRRSASPQPAVLNTDDDRQDATPTLAAALANGGSPENDESFEQGLAMLVEGMAKLLVPDGGASW